MKKRFMHISLIGALAIIIIFFGINVIDNFKSVDIKTLAGNREALGDMDILANRKIGLFQEKRYVISDKNIETETTMKLDDNNGFDIYENKDVFRFMWPRKSNSFYSEDWLAAIRGDNNTLEIRVKDRKTGETKIFKNKMKNNMEPIGVYVEDWKVNFLLASYYYEENSPIELMQYDFNTNELKVIKDFNKSSGEIKFNCRAGENVYLYVNRFVNNKDDNKSEENGLLSINLLDGTSEFYNTSKIFSENGVYYSDEDFRYDYNVSDGKIVGKVTNPSGHVYSFYTIDLKTKEVKEYKDVIDSREITTPGGGFESIREITLEGDKVYFMSDNFPEREFLIGVVDLKDNKLAFLGEFKGAEFSRFKFEGKEQ